jgi:hypothetical protein
VAGKKLSPSERLKIFGRLNRVWALHLTLPEFRLLSYLVDASVGYGRTTIDFTIDQMVNGSWSKDYLWLTPVNISRAAIVRGLNRLRELNAISWSSRGRQRVITINTNWKPEMPNYLREPKRLHPGAPKREKNVLPVSTKKANNRAPTEQHRQLVDSQTVSGESSRKRSDDPVVIINEIKSRPKKPTKSGRTKIEALWKEAWAEGHYDALPPGLSAKSRGQLTQAVARWPEKGEAAVRWTITNWRQIMRETFAWMGDPPSRPDPGFILRHIIDLNNAFASAEHIALYDFSDEAEYQRLLESGLSPLKAREEVTRRRIQREVHEEAAKERAALARDRRIIEEEKRQLLAERTKVRLSKEQREAILKGFDNGPEIRQTRDWWSEDGEQPPTDFGKWEDDEPS